MPETAEDIRKDNTYLIVRKDNGYASDEGTPDCLLVGFSVAYYKSITSGFTASPKLLLGNQATKTEGGGAVYNIDSIEILDSGKIAAEGTPLAMKNTYTGDFITLYGIDEADVKMLGTEYEPLRDAFRISVPNTDAATALILKYPEIFRDYEITKGKMDDVFLAVTGKKLAGGTEK